MVNKKKKIRTKGKLRFSRAFQELKNGECVAVDIERASKFSFPEKLQGKTGFVKSKKGRAYIVNLKDCTKAKEYIINPIHLKKISLITK